MFVKIYTIGGEFRELEDLESNHAHRCEFTTYDDVVGRYLLDADIHHKWSDEDHDEFRKQEKAVYEGTLRLKSIVDWLRWYLNELEKDGEVLPEGSRKVQADLYDMFNRLTWNLKGMKKHREIRFKRLIIADKQYWPPEN